MSDNGPTLDEKINGLRGDYERLQNDIGMKDVTQQLGDVSTDITGLPGAIASMRERGYAFAGYLERQAESLAEQWDDVQRQVRQSVDREIDRMQERFEEVRDQWHRLNDQSTDTGRERYYERARRVIDEVKEILGDARGRIEGLYGGVPEAVYDAKRQIQTILGYLELVDEATVDWDPTEAIFVAVEAEWVKTGKDKKDPDGILYLTDHRLIFEQKEKVGGRLGMGGEKVQDVLWETPVGAITDIRAEHKGMLGGKDMLNLKLSSGDYDEMTFEVKGGVDSKWYAEQLSHAVSGDIEKERAISVDEDLAQAVSDAPTACPTCGAPLPSLVRGMTELRCEYCGTVVRL
ncbi:MAG: hypothetical protein JW966_06795 [Anaerolineae bacterium]|nr:hypothetical protein [Anaerolineae bacterium]